MHKLRTEFKWKEQVVNYLKTFGWNKRGGAPSFLK